MFLSKIGIMNIDTIILQIMNIDTVILQINKCSGCMPLK